MIKKDAKIGMAVTYDLGGMKYSGELRAIGKGSDYNNFPDYADTVYGVVRVYSHNGAVNETALPLVLVEENKPDHTAAFFAAQGLKIIK